MRERKRTFSLFPRADPLRQGRREIVVPRNLSTDPFPEVTAERSEYPRERFDCFRPRARVTRIPAELLRIPRPPPCSIPSNQPFHHRVPFFPRPVPNRSDKNIRPTKIPISLAWGAWLDRIERNDLWKCGKSGTWYFEFDLLRTKPWGITIESIFSRYCGGRESISVSFLIGTNWNWRSIERSYDLAKSRRGGGTISAILSPTMVSRHHRAEDKGENARVRASSLIGI